MALTYPLCASATIPLESARLGRLRRQPPPVAAAPAGNGRSCAACHGRGYGGCRCVPLRSCIPTSNSFRPTGPKCFPSPGPFPVPAEMPGQRPAGGGPSEHHRPARPASSRRLGR